MSDDLAHYIGNPGEFPVLARWDFFNHAGVAPLPRVAADAMRAFAAQAEETAYLDAGWYRDVEKLRASAAAMIGAHRDEIAFVKNTSEGIATVAGGVEWHAGDRVVTTGVEYPANVYPWMDARNRFGVELVPVAEEIAPDGSARVPVEKILAAADHPRTRLVSLSHVQYASGQRLDVARVGEFCRGRGVLFCVDAIQSMGVLPLDVGAMHIDYLSADGHKWLLGPEGAGVFYCRRELLPATRPLVVGWMNVVNSQDYGRYDFTLRPDAGRFECGSYNVAGLLALKASLELLHRLGPAPVSARLKSLTDRLVEGVARKGYRILSPRGPGEWSGIVSFASPGGGRPDHDSIARTLRKEHRVEIAVREGRLRASPHFYNTDQQMDRLAELLP